MTQIEDGTFPLLELPPEVVDNIICHLKVTRSPYSRRWDPHLDHWAILPEREFDYHQPSLTSLKLTCRQLARSARRYRLAWPPHVHGEYDIRQRLIRVNRLEMAEKGSIKAMTFVWDTSVSPSWVDIRLILEFLPELHALQICCRSRVVLEPHHVIPPTSNLRHISLGRMEFEDGDFFTTLHTFLDMSRLEELRLVGLTVRQSHAGFYRTATPNRSSSLRRFYIDNCRLDSDMVGRQLGITLRGVPSVHLIHQTLEHFRTTLSLFRELKDHVVELFISALSWNSIIDFGLPKMSYLNLSHLDRGWKDTELETFLRSSPKLQELVIGSLFNSTQVQGAKKLVRAIGPHKDTLKKVTLPEDWYHGRNGTDYEPPTDEAVKVLRAGMDPTEVVLFCGYTEEEDEVEAEGRQSPPVASA